MDKYAERRKHFKTPPIDQSQSQEARRARLLEEQKRKRSQQVDAFRQLDRFSGLSLDDSEEDEDNEEDISLEKPRNSLSGVAQFATMLQPSESDPPPDSRSPSPFGGGIMQTKQPKSKKKRKGRGKIKPSKWANKCMYAELLEMREDTLWTESFDNGETSVHDGLPGDLERAWIGLAPVPVGKRCLAVVTQNAGFDGIIPNTVLRSRLLGKVILPPFPSPLPPNTVLDCILDENWRLNGLLHVLDVVRWKGQDVASCEASFRYWWRDTRLAEVPRWDPPAPHKSSFANIDTSPHNLAPRYVFPYPTTLVPVPYITPLPYEVILGELLDSARQGRKITLSLPILTDSSTRNEEMATDSASTRPPPDKVWTVSQLREEQVPISSDGLLLYVGEAAYESGESPLSVWVPRLSYDKVNHDEEHLKQGITRKDEENRSDVGESPLDMFERLIRGRMIAQGNGISGSGSSTSMTSNTVEVEMNT